jgi:hypothetical protein
MGSRSTAACSGIATRQTTVYGNTDGNKLVGGLTNCESTVNHRVTYHTLLDASDAAGRPELMAGELAPIHDGMLRDALDRPSVSLPRSLPALTRGCIA